MTESAMGSTIWDGEWDPHSLKPKEWLLLEDELESKEVNDPLIHRSKLETAKQLLHEIEDLGRNDTNNWLEEFPLFDEIPTLTPAEDVDTDNEGTWNLKSGSEPVSPADGSVVTEIQKPPANQDLFSVAYENAATFVLSNKNILFVNNQPFVSLTSLQELETVKSRICKEEKTVQEEEEEEKEKEMEMKEGSAQSGFLSDLESPDMAFLDELLRNTAHELDHWESDTSRSEASSDGTSAALELSPKAKEVEDDYEEEEEGEAGETDDPDWKPETPKVGGRAPARRAKPYSRGGSQEEKKLRKKEQNKNAATRYRLKRKAELKEIFDEEKLLKERKKKLEDEAADIQNDIKSLKGLLREFYRSKGIIN